MSFLSCSKDDEELPPAGVTKNLLSAFRDMQRSNETVRNMCICMGQSSLFHLISSHVSLFNLNFAWNFFFIHVLSADLDLNSRELSYTSLC